MASLLSVFALKIHFQQIPTLQGLTKNKIIFRFLTQSFPGIFCRLFIRLRGVQLRTTGSRLTKSLEISSSVELCEVRAHYAKGVRAFCITYRNYTMLRESTHYLSDKHETERYKTNIKLITNLAIACNCCYK